MTLEAVAVGDWLACSRINERSTVITVRGSGFQIGTTITVGGKTATAVYVDANTLQVTAPVNAAGAAQIIVQNPDGELYSLDAGLTYQ